MPRIDPVQIRRGTASEWASVNPELLEGELGIETDTRLAKVGPGLWNALPYAFPGAAGLHASTHQNGGSDEVSVSGLSGLLATPQTPAAHTHAEADVTGLVADLAAKAPLSHLHAEADVAGLVADLAAKAPLAHTHDAGDITTGTMAPARLGSGSGGAIRFLREDSTWQKVSILSTSYSYSPGSFTIETEVYAMMSNHLKLASTQRATLQGTGRLRITT